eukprot:jgi/Chrzof1/4743/Cz14g24190.t1_ELIP3[v5.2]
MQLLHGISSVVGPFRAFSGSNSTKHVSHPHRRCAAVSERDSSPTLASSSESDKTQGTLSNLDSLLGVPPEPTQPSVPAPTPATASSSSTASWSPLTSATPAGRSSSSTAGNKQPLQRAQQGFEQVMGFAGYAPEVVNGRAAMIGFMAAISGELNNGESVFAQTVSGGAGAAGLVIGAVLLASFAPAIRQVSWERMFGKDKSPANWGPFTPDAELRNGRAAMLGLAFMMFVEGASNQAFFM